MRVSLLTQDPVLGDFLEELFKGLDAYTLTREVDEKTQVVIQEDDTSLAPRDEKFLALPTIVLTKNRSHEPLTLVRPFKARALLTLLQALENQQQQPWMVGPLLFSPVQKCLSSGEKVIYLTQLEAAFFEALCESIEGCSSQMLQETVLGYAPDAQTHSVETHLYRLRKKLALIGFEDLIVSEPRGYSLSQGAHRQSNDPGLPHSD
jgi:DNA-binding winged helix-turn-helix (wHTH) protein